MLIISMALVVVWWQCTCLVFGKASTTLCKNLRTLSYSAFYTNVFFPGYYQFESFKVRSRPKWDARLKHDHPISLCFPRIPNPTSLRLYTSPLNFSFPFLSNPPEVRRKIYRMIFRASIPVYPTIYSLLEKDLARNCKIFPRPSFPVSFLLTSRQIYQEASVVLWGDNQIVLQFPLSWNREHSQSSEQTRLRWRRPPWFVRRHTFVPSVEHLRQIRNLIIGVYLFRSPCVNSVADRPGENFWEQLARFVDAIGEEHHIHTCEIRHRGMVSSNNPE